MTRPPDNSVTLSETLSLCEFKSGGHKGFWLYDKTRGMNLAMREETEREAMVKALHYYQERLASVEGELRDLRDKVDAFVGQFTEEDD